ncbi:hypothetical protein Goe24_01010 [Bacillus phage vB_BsuM-Goe24]|nr:hypothetical protein Goe24_01010 [Bacillus phage vB_BsuM-Goe24]
MLAPEKRSPEKLLFDYIAAVAEISWICRRAHIHGVDMNDITEIEEQIDKAEGRDKEIRDMMNK